jgi:hypothetical protein
VRGRRIVDDGRCPRWLALVFLPWIDLGILRRRRTRGFLVASAAVACGMAVMGVFMWRDIRDFQATWRQIPAEMRAGHRGPTR